MPSLSRLSLLVSTAILFIVSAVAFIAMVAVLSTRSQRKHQLVSISDRPSPTPIACTYAFSVTNASVPLPTIEHFTGSYATRNRQGVIEKGPLSGTPPYSITVSAQDVAFVVLPDEPWGAQLRLESVAKPGCPGNALLGGFAPTQLVQDPSATPNPATRSFRGLRSVPMPGGVSTACDPELLNALRWPTPPLGVPPRFTAPVPCAGSD